MMSEWYCAGVGLIADDDEYFRIALSAILKRLGFGTVIESGSFPEAVEQLDRAGQVSLSVFDLQMPGLDSPAGLRKIRSQFSVQKLAVVSASTSRGDILGSLEAGAHGYISKCQGVGELQSALKHVLHGAVYVPPALPEFSGSETCGAHCAKAQWVDNNPVHLTPRQRDVLRSLVEGRSNKEIARALGLGPGTVKVHLAALFRTLGVSNRAAAAVAGAEILRSRPEVFLQLSA